MPEGPIKKLVDSHKKNLTFIWFDRHALFSFIHPNETIFLYRATSALYPSAMTYIII